MNPPAAVPPSPSSPTAEAVKPPMPPPDDAENAPPLTPAAWLKQNGFYLVIIAAIIGLIIYKLGWSGLWQSFLVVIGLGFVIFIHELGHFLTAKWCDVHVQTFSLGFGPALPGCSFRYGETLYKIALFPLGGYVGMVGEGTELEGNDDYPRSFKNKTVGQRMLIISAGVFMNVLFCCIAFILVFRFHGIERWTMNIGYVEPGGPAWKEEVRTGSRVTKIGKSVRFPFTATYVSDPYFEDLKSQVAMSAEGEQLAFATEPVGPGGGKFDGFLTPRCDKNDAMPVIGVSPAMQLVLGEKYYKPAFAIPVHYNSPAAAARVLDLRPGTIPVEASAPDDPEKVTPLERGWPEVAERLRKLVNKPFVLRVRSGDSSKIEEIPVARELGFQWDDVIAGTTDPNQSDQNFDPFIVKKLERDKSNTQTTTYDFFEYQQRMVRLAGKPIIIQVHRKGDSAGANPVNVFVPPAFHRTFGARMRMGEVAAVRNNSSAAGAGLQPGDVITHVTMIAVTRGPLGLPKIVADLSDFDPCRLPTQLVQAATANPGLKYVYLTVDRPNPPGTPQNGDNNEDNHKASKVVVISPMLWDESWDDDAEHPFGATAALGIAQFGIAYRVDSTIVAVTPRSPADKAGLQVNDQIVEIAMRKWSEKDTAPGEWSNWLKMDATRGDEKRYDRWAYFDYALQELEFPEVQVKIKRNGSKDLKLIPEDQNAGLALDEDPTWPEADRGLLLAPDTRLLKAESTWEAVAYGFSRTGEFILTMYQSLRSIVTRRVSVDQVQGPVNIALMAFSAAQDLPTFILFLGMISLNLAVVNFLPIPVLDGGHMVFLIYEKLRGKPASETVQKWAMLFGLCIIGMLLLFVLYKEVVMRFINWKWR
jgi:membrane-associated protease RseP (regulator of RpoE activity)